MITFFFEIFDYLCVILNEYLKMSNVQLKYINQLFKKCFAIDFFKDEY